LGKSIHLNRLIKKQISGLGLPPVAVTKIKKTKKALQPGAQPGFL